MSELLATLTKVIPNSIWNSCNVFLIVFLMVSLIETIKFSPNSHIFTKKLCLFFRIKHSSTKWRRSTNQNLLLPIHASCLTDTLVPWEVHLKISLSLLNCICRMPQISEVNELGMRMKIRINLPRSCGQAPWTWFISLWKYNLKIEEQHYSWFLVSSDLWYFLSTLRFEPGEGAKEIIFLGF